MAPARDESIRQLLRPIAAFLGRPEVSELAINRPHEIWTRSEHQWHRHEIAELTETQLGCLARAIISDNRVPNDPIVSVILPGGHRGQIVQPPACIDGTVSMNFRKHSVTAKTLTELIDEGMFEPVDVGFSPNAPTDWNSAYRMEGPQAISRVDLVLLEQKYCKDWLQFLRRAILAKKNIVVAGKTGSGKTTLARSLIKEVPDSERIVTIEDVHELVLEQHPNRVHMIFGAGHGRVTAEDCLKSAMRQSPDRIFLSEMRGDEAWEYLLSLNTGHPGSVSTVHANGAVQAFHRIESLVAQSPVGRTLSAEAIRDMIYRTVDIVLWMEDWLVKEVYFDPIFAKGRQ